MNWLKKSDKHVLILVTAVAFGISSCSEGNKKYLKRTASNWQKYVNEISGKQPKLTNTVLLVLKSKECEPCIEEIDWWNNFITESSTLNVYMIIIEKYETTFTTFLDHNEFEINAFRDETGLVLEQQLVPKTPVKLYIDKKGDVRFLESININSNPENFYNKISQIID
ncbi:hypothetical protein [Gracilimonas sp.]|uniref:hypothetical protein n=1 Tax=Gracilimonas sp. TaxID=1974203 RepID=UPI00287298BF|nr:hypothetical protein [Gracilimonas sp.]